MVLDRVVSPAWQKFRHPGPLVSELPVALKNDAVLFFGPVSRFYEGIKMVVPAFSALLADATWQAQSDVAPVSRAVLLNHFP